MHNVLQYDLISKANGIVIIVTCCGSLNAELINTVKTQNPYYDHEYSETKALFMKSTFVIYVFQKQVCGQNITINTVVLAEEYAMQCFCNILFFLLMCPHNL